MASFLEVTANPQSQVWGFCVEMRTIYYTEDGLAERIREVREMREILLEREEELIMSYHAIQGKENCVIDNKGNVTQLGPKTKQSYHEKRKPRETMIEIYRDRVARRPVWEK